MHLFYKNNKGFTLIELISIIIILGILAAIAIPRYYNYKSTAELTVVKATLSNVRTSINNFYLHKVVEEGTGRYPSIDELNTSGIVKNHYRRWCICSHRSLTKHSLPTNWFLN